MKLHLSILILICFCYAPFTSAQNLTYNILTTETGLPSNEVYYIFQDSKGYIWFCTKNGAGKWDSKKFKYFTIADGLPNNEVYQVYEDSFGRIWFSTFNKTLAYLDNNKFHNASNDTFLKQLKTYPGSLIRELNQELYFISPEQQLSKVNLKSHKISHFGNAEIRTHAYLTTFDNKVWALEHTNKFKNKLTGTDTSIEQNGFISPNPDRDDTFNTIDYIHKTYSFRHGLSPPFYCSSFSNPKLESAFFNNGDIIEMYDNLYYFTKSKHIIPITGHSCHIIIGNMLFSTSDNGLMECRQIPILAFQPKVDISNNIKFLIKHRNTLYGINDVNQIIDIAGQQIVNRFKNDLINTYNLAYFDSSYYLSSSKNIYKFTSPQAAITTLPHFGILNNFKYVAPSHNKDSFYVTNGSSGGLYSIDKKSNQARSLTPNSKRAVYTVFESHSGKLWFSTLDSVFFKKNGKEASTTAFVLDKKIPVFCHQFEEDRSGNMFFVTNNGVFVYDGKYKYRLDKKNLLTDNECNSLVIDEKNHSFWVATKNGLTQIRYSKTKDKLVFKVVNKFFASDGLFSNVINDMLIDSNKLYIATEKGVNVLDELSYRPDSINIPVYIKLTSINGSNNVKNIDNQSIQLEFDQNNLSLNFEALYFMRRDRLKVNAFLYRNGTLISKSEQTEDKIDYYSLNDGNYKLVLYAFDQDYLYVHGSSAPFLFTIHPPYYKTWWFIGGLSLIVIIITTAILLWSLSRKRARITKQAVLDAKLNESTLKSLQNQMNPHFVFNSLNTIQHFITSKKDEEALDYLSDFSGLMRNMLVQSVNTLISLEKEIDFLKQYVQLEKTRFINAFDVEWDIQLSEDDIADIYIPTMLIQPILENAVKHGISSLENEKGKIEIIFKLQNEYLLSVTVNNTGRANKHKSTKGNSIALQTIKERLKIYTKNNIKGAYTLIIKENGATANITIPI